MATSVNWLTGEIFVPRADMPVIQVSPEIRELDTTQFWLDLKDLEATVDGIPWPDTQTNFPSYVISGVTYAQAFLIIPPYFVTFEDGQYGVNLTGTNNNILDVATQNQVRIGSNNSAGLQVVTSGSGVTQQDKDDIENQIFARLVEGGFSFENIVRILAANAAGTIEEQPDGSYIIRGIDGTTARIEGDDSANGGRTITGRDGS